MRLFCRIHAFCVRNCTCKVGPPCKWCKLHQVGLHCVPASGMLVSDDLPRLYNFLSIPLAGFWPVAIKRPFVQCYAAVAAGINTAFLNSDFWAESMAGSFGILRAHCIFGLYA